MAAVILAAASLSAQQQDSACDTKSETKSLGEIASKKPSGSSTAKVRIDDDSLDSVISKVKQPIPDITLDGLDNSDEIVTAINDYKAHHTPEETEAMLKDWWDRHETALIRFADENKALSDRLQDQRYYYQEQSNYGRLPQIPATISGPAEIGAIESALNDGERDAHRSHPANLHESSNGNLHALPFAVRLVQDSQRKWNRQLLIHVESRSIARTPRPDFLSTHPIFTELNRSARCQRRNH